MKAFVRLSICTLFVISATMICAQPTDQQPGVSNIFKLNFFLPGISYEQRIGPYQSLYTSAFMDFNTANTSELGVNQIHIFLTPTVNASIRNYYNFNKRAAKGLNTALNNGNYLAPIYIGRYALTNPYEDHRWINQIGAVWGIQRNSLKGFSLDFNVGMSYIFNMQHSAYYSPVSLIAQISLGYWIGRK